MQKHINRKKSILGQNFILDKDMLLSLLDCCDLSKDDTVLEIGAGLGTLTEVLAENVKRLVSLEIDKSLMPYLKLIADKKNNIELINDDFLRWDMDSYFSDAPEIKVVANIPYYITSDIYHKLIFSKLKITEINCMVQLEVAQKLVAGVKDKGSYGTLTLLCKHKYDVTIEKIVPKENFSPIPKVDSAFVCMKLKNSYKNDSDFDKEYYRIVKSAFLHRRKTLVNSLKSSGYDTEEVIKSLDELGLNPKCRAEELQYGDYIALTTKLKI